MLLREEPRSAWSEPALVERLRLSSSLVAEALAGLRRAGLVEATDAGMRFAPRDTELAAGVERLARFYATDRAAVLSWMNRNALARIRRAAAERFADAFRLKRREDGGGPDA